MRRNKAIEVLIFLIAFVFVLFGFHKFKTWFADVCYKKYWTELAYFLDKNWIDPNTFLAPVIITIILVFGVFFMVGYFQIKITFNRNRFDKED